MSVTLIKHFAFFLVVSLKHGILLRPPTTKLSHFLYLLFLLILSLPNDLLVDTLLLLESLLLKLLLLLEKLVDFLKSVIINVGSNSFSLYYGLFALNFTVHRLCKILVVFFLELLVIRHSFLLFKLVLGNLTLLQFCPVVFYLIDVHDLDLFYVIRKN